MKQFVIALALILGYWATAATQSVQLYTDEQLGDALRLYGRNLRGMWQEDLVARMRGDQLSAGRRMTLELPLMGRDGQPFEYYADVASGVVTVPIASVKFLDDVSIAYAWYESRGCDVATIGDYAGMLRFRAATATARGLAPRVALGVPPDALDNAFVNDVSGKLLKSAVYFLMAHEFAHVYYKHKGYDTITLQEAQAQEIASDAFALDVMRRISVAPAGMVAFFVTVSRLRSTPGDYATTAEYDAAIRREATHPVTAARLTTLGKAIKDDAATFAAGQADPALWRSRISQIGAEVEAVGRLLDDRQFRQSQAKRNRTMTPDALARSCQR